MNLKVAMRAGTREALKCKDYRHRLGAVVLRGNNVIAVACNRAGKHAEVRAMLRARSVGIDLRTVTLFVVRVPRDNRPAALSKPCDDCQRALVKNGIKSVYFTSSDGEVVRL